jgi:hypothetical protein
MQNAKSVNAELGHWKTPKTLEEAKQITDTIIDNMDPEWLMSFGLELLGVPEATAWVRDDWVQKRRPPLREHVPYFVFMLSINVFFCLVLPTELLRDGPGTQKARGLRGVLRVEVCPENLFCSPLNTKPILIGLDWLRSPTFGPFQRIRWRQ